MIEQSNWTEIEGAEVKMRIRVHGLSGFSAIEQAKSPCTGVHIFTFAPLSPFNLASVLF
jgi:hypothetical protein